MDKFKNFIKSLLLFTIFFISAVYAASVQTDKQNYEFGETVLIYGNGFSSGQEVGIEIRNPNVVPVFVNQTFPDQNENFTNIFPIGNPDPIYMIEGTYTLYAGSQSGSAQTTFTVTSATIDTTPPTFSGNQTNETQPGKSCEFKLTWNDNKALHPSGQYIFSTDNSGTWMNAPSVNFTSTPQTVSYITNLRSTEGLVQWKYIATDNAGNQRTSDTYEINVVTTTTTVPCDLQKVNITPRCSSSECGAGEKIEVNAVYSGNCPDTSYIQVNANGTDCFICCDHCNMTGITVSCSDSSCYKNWTIPTIPAECQGKNVNATYSFISDGDPCDGHTKKDSVTPTGSFTFYLTTTTPTTTSPGGDGGGATSTSTTTTTIITTTTYTTTELATTTYSGMATTTLPSKKATGSSTYWIIIVIVFIAVAGVFVWFKYFRGTEESAFERLKQKWRR
jgi:hypothetical protein